MIVFLFRFFLLDSPVTHTCQAARHMKNNNDVLFFCYLLFMNILRIEGTDIDNSIQFWICTIQLWMNLGYPMK